MAVYADGTKAYAGDIIRPIDNPCDGWTQYVSTFAEVLSTDTSHCAIGNIYCRVEGRGNLYLRAADFVPVAEDAIVDFDETEFLSLLGGD